MVQKSSIVRYLERIRLILASIIVERRTLATIASKYHISLASAQAIASIIYTTSRLI